MMNQIPVIPIQLKDLLDNMTFIGNIPPNYKLSVNSRCYSDSTSWLSWTFRRWESESSDLTVNFIYDVCLAATQAYHEYLKTHFEQVILSKIVSLRHGIKNIQKTYRLDVKTSNALETSILILDLVLPIEIKQNLGILPFPSPKEYSSPSLKSFLANKDKHRQDPYGYLPKENNFLNQYTGRNKNDESNFLEDDFHETSESTEPIVSNEPTEPIPIPKQINNFKNNNSSVSPIISPLATSINSTFSTVTAVATSPTQVSQGKNKK